MQGKLYICTEYANGGTLHQCITENKGSLPEELVWKLLIQVRCKTRGIAAAPRTLQASSPAVVCQD